MEEIMKYVKPELLMVAVVLYFIGIRLKQSQAVRDKDIPLILGGIGIVLCAVWVFASCPTSTGQEIAMAVCAPLIVPEWRMRLPVGEILRADFRH